MTPSEIRNTLRKFLATFIRRSELHDSENIFKAGFVNSLFAMQLVLFVEKSFTLTVENEDLDIENFCSIDAMTSFILMKHAKTRLISVESQ